MKVLDLFCGLGGWSKAFAEAGHDCTGIDHINLGYPYRFIKADLNDWKPDRHYDVILASPPCTEFSIAKKWGYGNQDERIGLDLIWKTFALIEKIKPKYYVVENVKGLAEFLPKPADIIKYNRHKDGKAAYLWSNIGKLGFLCSTINYRKDECKNHASRALIPYPLSKAVLTKIENDYLHNMS